VALKESILQHTVFVGGAYFGTAFTPTGRDMLLRTAREFGVPSLTITEVK